jgi:hypothetical protein
MFAYKGLPEWSTFQVLYLGLALTRKYYIWLERPARDKYSSLFDHSKVAKKKSFVNTAPALHPLRKYPAG